ncbi:lipase family alpha/beta hydrolase [Nocardia asteroides]|uniref:lipase family alpha/beta hydrolase n=1 Tax=Nocardia asteroides TaxID=1824 RepID=UPI001E439682|nr:alpha/beta hydrolase [Nocardia asteroides]UGT62074.1 GPI inositol-deacylase [Nocardia asteroides]
MYEDQRRAEVRALARLAGDELGGAVAGIATVHRAVADRVFTAVRWGVGPAAAPVQVAHDAIADGVYAIVGTVAETAGRVAERTADLPNGEPPSRTVFGAGLLGVLSGLIGDRLAEQNPVLTGPMSFRVDGQPVAPEELGSPHDTLVVFVHGLVETEHAWRRGGTPGYAERLAEELPCATAAVRFNSGLHISENARELADLLERTQRAWPVPLRRIALVGHSMGGLVARAACHLAAAEGAAWVRLVRQIVCLGSPHLGAPLEQFVHVVSAGLVKLPETRPFGRLLRRRSAGIRDLRQGSLVDEDWTDLDIDALTRRVQQEVPLLPGVEHYFVTASIIRNPKNPLGRIVGDGLVLTPSGSGRGRARRIAFEPENGLHLPGANHFTLLNDEAVHEALRRWLAAAPPLPRP